MKAYTYNEIQDVITRAYAVGFRHGQEKEPFNPPPVLSIVAHPFSGSLILGVGNEEVRPKEEAKQV